MAVITSRWPAHLLWSRTSREAELTRAGAGAVPSDGLIVFAAMWGMAMLFSLASQNHLIAGREGVALQLLTVAGMGTAALLILRPRQLMLFLALPVLVSAVYVLRMPVSSNNQTIALCMNIAILSVMAVQFRKHGLLRFDQDATYEQLRMVAKALLAIMYFFGIFHKINTGFFDPATSCATALYVPLTRDFGLDDNIYGRYLAIWATFIIEAIAIVCIYWTRFFWVGLVLSLPFHYIIPISGFSWYMDFSSLVFALYMLSVPREVSRSLYVTTELLTRARLSMHTGTIVLLAFGAVLMVGALYVLYLTSQYPGRSDRYIWHSMWLVAWSIVGGIAMVLIIRAALLELPYSGKKPSIRIPAWVYVIPGALFISSWSPYVGLKTESSIAMFSNLHTEGGVSNHLLFPKPPYLFPYQEKVGRIIASSNPDLLLSGYTGEHLVEHDIALRILGNPDDWVTYELEGQRFERVTAATYTGYRPNFFESKLLDFKPVDWRRPKICTH